MADDQTEDFQKTEEPTQKKLDDARAKGQVANSREINHWFIILAGAAFIGILGEAVATDIHRGLYKFLQSPHAIPLDSGHLRVAMEKTLTEIGFALGMPLLLLMAAALAAGMVQNGLIISAESLKPKFEKISLTKGIKRLFSAKSLVEFAKGIAKLVIVGAVATMLMMPEFDNLDTLPGMPADLVLPRIQSLAVRLLAGVLAVVSLVAGLDFLFQRIDHHKKMRMTRHEVKEEMKQSEGDPIVRSRLRQIRQERARQRMMSQVPDSTVVITNPTHFAVALKYEEDTMDAPVVMAKGQDQIAQRIREVARENDIPIVENKPLARALFATAEIDQEIPTEHYKAVAQVIGYVFGLRHRAAHRSRI